ncbi:cell surface protein [Horticoccus luteus]|uniref:Cell surface protein n=1 Tax=Horticoccus luteus TaxID=2862869 RepID=A0A8F9XLB1_9BACT|nr:IPT/TIG domain-containing protein [Horticoccus luteus]QYM80513.1 cell surface protein [Horticoccus luteus]
MHTNRISLARKICLWLGILLGVMLLSGCDSVVLTNLTPGSLAENPSQIYTITLRVTPKIRTIVPGSVAPHIIIDGENHAMTASALGANLWEYEYHLPPGRDEIAYYFLVNYSVEHADVSKPAETYTALEHAKIVRRYVLSLEVNRGPVGARVSVLGRGFNPNDTIYFDNVPARTVYESPNALSFYVPAIDAARNYHVMLGSDAGTSPVGTFRIDASSLTVTPASLSLRSGETQSLTFSVPNPAPAGGLLLDVTTDVPDSVIMPEVVVPAGQTSVTINVQGGSPGSGSLFLKGYAGGELTIPVSVTAR